MLHAVTLVMSSRFIGCCHHPSSSLCVFGTIAGYVSFYSSSFAWQFTNACSDSHINVSKHDTCSNHNRDCIAAVLQAFACAQEMPKSSTAKLTKGQNSSRSILPRSSMATANLSVGQDGNNARAAGSVYPGAGVLPEGCCSQPHLGHPDTAPPHNCPGAHGFCRA